MAKQRSNTPSRNDAKVAYEPSKSPKTMRLLEVFIPFALGITFTSIPAQIRPKRQQKQPMRVKLNA